MTSTGVSVVNPAGVGGPRANPASVIDALAADLGAASLGQRRLELAVARPRTCSSRSAPPAPSPTRCACPSATCSKVSTRDWLDAGATRVAYKRAPARAPSYRFRVAATNGDGACGTEDAMMAFTVQPAFVQTRTFYALYAVGIAGLLVTGARQLHVRRVRREFEMVLAERACARAARCTTRSSEA